MGYQGDDRQGGDNRWRDRDERWGGSDRDRDLRGDDRGWNEGRREERGWGSGGSGHAQDRGFFERAGEEVRSWFGGSDDDRHRGRHDRGHGGGHDGGSYGWMSNGWGNQAGESWNRDRPGVRERDGWFTDSVGGERGRRFGGSGGGLGPSEDFGRGFAQGGKGGGSSYGSGYGMNRSEMWEGTGFEGSERGGRYGSSPAPFGSGSSRHGMGMREQGGSQQYGHHHDPHYSEWRRRQIDDLDRDYDEYRREHQSKFENEFGGWRQKRQGQRQMLNKVAEHMEVVGSDGQHIGTVDAVRGDRIILTKADQNAGGVHHSIPCGWVENVDERVTVNKTAEEALQAWRSEEHSRALFEREDQGSPGPHMLNRSFSGTYKDRDD